MAGKERFLVIFHPIFKEKDQSITNNLAVYTRKDN